MATEDIAKKVIVKGIHDIIPNYLAGGMDAIEGTYVWNHTTSGCPEEEWEELYKGKLGILEDEVITLDRSAGQRDPGRRSDHIGSVGRPKSMAEAGKGSDHVREKGTQYTPSARVCGMRQASANTEHGQGACYVPRGENWKA